MEKLTYKCRGCGARYTKMVGQQRYCKPDCRKESTMLLHRYGINKVEWNRIYNKQNCACAICSAKDTPLVVDHCHKNLHVRGLLCNSCNVGLGHFSDDTVVMRQAIRYLRKRVGILQGLFDYRRS
jgi:hypothetical protein